MTLLEESVAYLSLPLQEQVRKVYSAVPIEFKGHGFYRTDKSGK